LVKHKLTFKQRSCRVGLGTLLAVARVHWLGLYRDHDRLFQLPTHVLLSAWVLVHLEALVYVGNRTDVTVFPFLGEGRTLLVALPEVGLEGGVDEGVVLLENWVALALVNLMALLLLTGEPPSVDLVDARGVGCLVEVVGLQLVLGRLFDGDRVQLVLLVDLQLPLLEVLLVRLFV